MKVSIDIVSALGETSIDDKQTKTSDGAHEQLYAHTDGDPKSATDGVCSVCSRSAAFRCNGCCDAPNFDTEQIANDTWYCGSECQKKHWSEHKSTCKRLQQRTQIWHTGELLKAIWLYFRRQTWEMDIKSVSPHDKYLVMIQDNAPEQLPRRLMHTFPDSLIQDASIANVMLCYRTCEEAIVYLRPLLEGILQGQFKKIELVRTHTKNHDIRPVVLDGRGKQQSNKNGFHLVFKITMGSGEVFCLDTTASQYSWPESVMLWDTWCEQRSLGDLQTVKHFTTMEDYIPYYVRDEDATLLDFCRIHERFRIGRKMFRTIFQSFECGGLPMFLFPKLKVLFRAGSRQEYDERANALHEFLRYHMPLAIDDLYNMFGDDDRAKDLGNFMKYHSVAANSKQARQAYEVKCLKELRLPQVEPIVDASNVINLDKEWASLGKEARVVALNAKLKKVSKGRFVVNFCCPLEQNVIKEVQAAALKREQELNGTNATEADSNLKIGEKKQSLAAKKRSLAKKRK